MALWLLTIIPGPALAQTRIKNILIDANEAYRDTQKNLVQLNGNVQIVYKDQHISANKATIFLKTSQIIASGNVILETPKTHVEATELEYNYKTRTGVFKDSFIPIKLKPKEPKWLRKIRYF